MMKPSRSLTYIAQTQPGFEAIAVGELEELEDVRILGTQTVSDKNGMIRFEYAGDPADLLDLRTIEDLFVLVARVPELPPTYSALRDLAAAVTRASGIERGLQLARQIHPGRGGEGRFRFRVIARLAAQTHYRRVDAQEAVTKAIAQRTDHRWQPSDTGTLEFWLTIFPDEALLMLRLTDERMRHRTYKLEHLPASLRPTPAAALVRLTRPKPDDVFLDPMCGAGTILIERALAGRYQLLLGGDNDPLALETAQGNIGTRYQPIELHDWDAMQLPLDAGVISAAAVNLPFGAQIGSAEENRLLYPAFLREAVRVLRPHARLVVLTGDWRTFDTALKRTDNLYSRTTHPVMILGRAARIYVLQRGA